MHRIYLGIASFTAEYLDHQATEEVQVMPVLATRYTLEALLKAHHEILSGRALSLKLRGRREPCEVHAP